jgi:hypothetical protein
MAGAGKTKTYSRIIDETLAEGPPAALPEEVG